MTQSKVEVATLDIRIKVSTFEGNSEARIYRRVGDTYKCHNVWVGNRTMPTEKMLEDLRGMINAALEE